MLLMLWGGGVIRNRKYIGQVTVTSGHEGTNLEDLADRSSTGIM
jgi:hypothetical protein